MTVNTDEQGNSLTTSDKGFRPDASYKDIVEKSWFEVVTNLVKQYPNDTELGKEIRKLMSHMV